MSAAPGVLAAECIPVLTATTINFEPYKYDRQQEVIERQSGRRMTYSVPTVEERSLSITISNLIGSTEAGYRDVGFQEFTWKSTPTAAVAGIHNGLSEWQTLIATDNGVAIMNAAKASILSLVRSSIPSFVADIPGGMGVPLSARLQRIETRLRWDYPDDNMVLAYIQFGTDDNFVGKLSTVPFAFLSQAKIDSQIPRNTGETDEDWEARQAVALQATGAAKLEKALELAEFQTFAQRVHSLVYSELKSHVVRFEQIDIAAIDTAFVNTWPMLVALSKVHLQTPSQG